MLFSLLKHYLDLYISDTALKVFWSLYCFTTSICHGIENYFPRLWGTGISDAIIIGTKALECFLEVTTKHELELKKNKIHIPRAQNDVLLLFLFLYM